MRSPRCRTRRRIHLLRQRPFLVMRAGNDRNVIVTNAERMKRTRARRRGGGVGTESQNQRT